MHRLFLPVILVGFLLGCVQEPIQLTAEVPKTACENRGFDWNAELARLELVNPNPLTKNQKKRFLPGYLAMHPKPHPNTNTIYLVAMGPVVWAYFVSGYCITHVDEIPISIVSGWMNSKEA